MAPMSSLSASVETLLTAVEARDVEEFEAALPDIARAIQRAGAEELQAALVRLEPVLDRTAFVTGAGLARLIGEMAWSSTDPTVVMPALARRAVEVMELADRFVTLYRDRYGQPPRPGDHEQAERVLERVAGSADELGLSPLEVEMLVQAWFIADDWVQPVLFLCQRAEVRTTLPLRERLTTAAEPVKEYFGTVSWLARMLQVPDGLPLIVLDRGFAGTGRGYHVTIGGIADNFQLHTLLAAALIGDPGKGLLPGRRPTPAEIAAATGGDPTPPQGIRGNWQMVDAHGERIWHERHPGAIPTLDGVRVVVLEQERGPYVWDPGRVFPLMTPHLTVHGALTSQEAAHWLNRISTGNP